MKSSTLGFIEAVASTTVIGKTHMTTWHVENILARSSQWDTATSQNSTLSPLIGELVNIVMISRLGVYDRYLHHTPSMVQHGEECTRGH